MVIGAWGLDIDCDLQTANWSLQTRAHRVHESPQERSSKSALCPLPYLTSYPAPCRSAYPDLCLDLRLHLNLNPYLHLDRNLNPTLHPAPERALFRKPFQKSFQKPNPSSFRWL